MFKPNSKYRLFFLVLAVLIFAYQSVNGFYAFANNYTNKGMKMIFAIVFGILAIIYFVDLIAFIKNRKSIKAGE